MYNLLILNKISNIYTLITILLLFIVSHYKELNSQTMSKSENKF